MRALLLATLALAAACAATRPPPRELLAARESLRRAEASPAAARAPDELAAAQRALVDAEKAQDRKPGSDEARDRAYLAWRQADRARITGLYSADLEALGRGRQNVERLRRNIDKQEVDGEMQAWLDDERQQLRDEGRARRERVLSRHSRAFDDIEQGDDGPVLVLSCPRLFVPGQLRLAPGAARRINAAVEVLRAGPAPNIRIVVASDEQARGTDAALLAQHRAERIRDELVARGYPPELIEVQSRVSSDGRVSIAILY